MARRRIRWFGIGTDRYLKGRGHTHDEVEGTAWQFTNCRDLLQFQREGSRGKVLITFRSGDGFLVADGYPMHSGEIRHADGRGLNLNMPSVIRALLDEALARGWDPFANHITDLDGWLLFDAAYANAPAGRYASWHRVTDR